MLASLKRAKERFTLFCQKTSDLYEKAKSEVPTLKHCLLSKYWSFDVTKNTFGIDLIDKQTGYPTKVHIGYATTECSFCGNCVGKMTDWLANCFLPWQICASLSFGWRMEQPMQGSGQIGKNVSNTGDNFFSFVHIYSPRVSIGELKEKMVLQVRWCWWPGHCS